MRRNTGKVFLTIGYSLLTGLLFFSPVFVLTARADADPTYTGQLDPFTGEAVLEQIGENEVTTLSDRRMITENMYYDYSTGLFAYPVDNDLSDVLSNAADGMVLNEPVEVRIPDGVSVSIFRDGNQVDFANEYRTRGSYSVMIQKNGVSDTLFTFTIIGAKTGKISSYQLPQYFRFDSITLDGVEIGHTRNFVELMEEGYYEISYRCERTDIKYKLNVTIDHTPPQVVFEGIGEDGKARGPVTWGQLKDDEYIKVYKEGSEYLYTNNRLTQSGTYEIVVTDDADNVLDVNFVIMIYLDKNGFMFVGIIVVVVGALAGYLIYQRKHMKVR